jgi:cell division protease FtsH
VSRADDTEPLGSGRPLKDAVDLTAFDEAIDRVVGGLERKSRMINPKEKEIVAYHEAGHALGAESREHADRVAKISVIPRGVAALGYTQQQPTEDRYLMTRTELLDRLDVLLGGRVAEELVFGDISTGAQDDLQRATDMARHMIARYGMSEALGLATFEPPRQALFLNVPSMAQREYSEETARRIDAEIQKLQHYDISISYVGHAARWDAIEVDGNIEQHDASVRYRADGRLLAVASILRDRESLEAELAMEHEVRSGT